MRARWLFPLLALLHLGALAREEEAPAVENTLGMSFVETPDLRLIYFDSLRYLEPHTIRTFTNSLAWQKRVLGWVPYDTTTVFLKDLAAKTHRGLHGRVEEVARRAFLFQDQTRCQK